MNTPQTRLFGDSETPAIIKRAKLSDCRTYRYSLERIWQEDAGLLVIIGLNPSTADETDDDPTIRRCIRFARDWGYGGLVMTNLFAFRATKPADMIVAADPVGADNDLHLWACAGRSKLVLAAWGTGGGFQGRDSAVLEMVTRHTPVFCLKTTKDGHPWHPLYVPAATKPVLFRPAKSASGIEAK